jgi:hypothetical protein
VSFKVGDVVRYTNKGGYDWSGFSTTSFYTVTDIKYSNERPYIIVDGRGGGISYSICQFRSASVKDTKVARAFYKNRIKEIRDGKIFITC